MLKELNNQNIWRGYFGKIPAFNDFIKYNAANRELLVIDKWLQEGLILAKQRLKNDWKIIYKNSLPIKFFYPFTGTDNFISGIIFPSNDRNGREFPFLIFSILNKDSFNKIPFFLLPLVLSNELNSFEVIFNYFNNNVAISNLNQEISQLSNPSLEGGIIEQFQIFKNNLSQGKFWLRIYADYCESKKYNVIDNIFNTEIKNSTLAMNFNFFSEKDNIDLDLCFLLNIIAVSKGNLFFPAVFWTNDFNNICLFIFPSKPTPLNYLNLIQLNESDDRILSAEKKLKSSHVTPFDLDFLNKNEMKLTELLQILNLL